MSDDSRPPCAVCGEQFVPAMEWLQLNRYGICTGQMRAFTETTNVDGEHVFDVSDDIEHEDVVTGPVLHWPTCANIYIEGRLAQFRVVAREKGWAQ